jgi:hypothetical protein
MSDPAKGTIASIVVPREVEWIEIAPPTSLKRSLMLINPRPFFDSRASTSKPLPVSETDRRIATGVPTSTTEA